MTHDQGGSKGPELVLTACHMIAGATQLRVAKYAVRKRSHDWPDSAEIF